MTRSETRPEIHPPRGLLVAVAILLVAAVVSAPVINALIPPEELGRYVLLTGVPFLTTFAAIIIGFIYFIWWLASRLNRRITQRVYRPIEAVVIGGIVLGIIGMFQGWVFEGFQFGFPLLLLSTLAFIVWSHIVPRGSHHHEDIGPVSVDDSIIPPTEEGRYEKL